MWTNKHILRKLYIYFNNDGIDDSYLNHNNYVFSYFIYMRNKLIMMKQNHQ